MVSNAPSDWITRWSHLLAKDATVLDIACGSGRHLRYFSEQGHAITGIDQDISGIPTLPSTATLVKCDIERHPWPLITQDAPTTFGAVIVTNYLWRPLFPTILQSIGRNGVLLYETFAIENAAVGRPSRPEYLLEPGELLELCKSLRVVAYEHGFLENPARIVQRIAAVQSDFSIHSDLDPTRIAL